MGTGQSAEIGSGRGRYVSPPSTTCFCTLNRPHPLPAFRLVPPGPSPAYSRINITAPVSPTTLHTSAYEDGTEGSETSAYINQTLGNYPKGNLLYSVHGESLKSRISFKSDFPFVHCVVCSCNWCCSFVTGHCSVKLVTYINI